VEKNKPKIENIRITFSQEPDCCDNGEIQELEIYTEDGGGGVYYVIETERWAFDSIEELTALINKVKLRLEL